MLAFSPAVVLLTIGTSVGLVAVGRLAVVQAVLLAVGGMWVIGWVTWAQLGLSALMTKFDNERGRAPFIAVLLSMLHTLLFAGVHVLLIVWVGMRLGDSQSMLGHPLVGVPLTVVAAALCIGTAFIGQEGGRRLERLDTP